MKRGKMKQIKRLALPLTIAVLWTCAPNTVQAASSEQKVTVYVVDTGVYSQHVAFSGTVRSGFSNVQDQLGTEDCSGHGTHVAGIIQKVAPMAEIVPVRTFDCSAEAWTSDIIAGVDWAIADHELGVPAVLNLSISGGLSTKFNDAVRRAIADGIVVVAAAGNNAKDACAYSPGATPEAITVGAVDLDAAPWVYSNYGSCIDFYAPGVSIESAWYLTPTSSKVLKGTSHAASFVSGYAAKFLSRTPTASVSAVHDAIKSAATASVVSVVGGTTYTHGIADPLGLIKSQVPVATTTTTTVPQTTTTTTVSPTTTVPPEQHTDLTYNYSFTVPAYIMRTKGVHLFKVWLTVPGQPKTIVAAEYLQKNTDLITVKIAGQYVEGSTLHVTYFRVG
jgi:subtilisin family serine protease